ncbi:MAG: hypothetical protein PHD47_02835 [Acholeplasmataceae bacterium]|nr:hypothetical protein [Acholeplasmataceae bacterium]
MTIFEKIEQKGLEEAREILESARLESESILAVATEKINDQVAQMIQNEKEKARFSIEQKQNSFELEKRQSILAIKSTQIDRVINRLRTDILSLKGSELLDFSVSLIKDESLTGDEHIRVSTADYDKYLNAFSSEKKSDLVNLDKLNKKLGKGFNISLESEPADITDGFLVIGEIFDLNFSIEPFLKDIKAKYEKQIYDILFG